MTIKLQACFDIDLPTVILEMMEKLAPKAENGTHVFYTSPRAFGKQYPATIPYLVKNGWMTAEALVLVINGGKDEEEAVAEPVAQPTELSGDALGGYDPTDDAS